MSAGQWIATGVLSVAAAIIVPAVLWSLIAAAVRRYGRRGAR